MSRRFSRVCLILFFFAPAPIVFAQTTTNGFAPPSVRGWSTEQVTPQVIAAKVLSVLDYLRAHVTQESLSDLEGKIPPYNRLENFGGWIKSDEASSCYDTRAQILIRSADPSTPVTFTATGCTVFKGLWHDPYAGTDYKMAKAVQIDHVVPLKHVYLTGASDWAPAHRCSYANFTHNTFHLLAVSGHENMSKGDKGPEDYLPPNDSFKCEYVASWMKVKAIWNLIATQPELEAVEKVIQTLHCSDSKFEVTESDFQAEEDAANTIPIHCRDFGVAVIQSPIQH